MPLHFEYSKKFSAQVYLNVTEPPHTLAFGDNNSVSWDSARLHQIMPRSIEPPSTQTARPFANSKSGYDKVRLIFLCIDAGMIEYCLGMFIVVAVNACNNITSLFPLLRISGYAHD